MIEKLKHIKKAFLHVDSRTIYLYALITGCFTGLMAILFQSTIEFLSSFFFEDVAHFPLGQLQSIFQGPSAEGAVTPNYLIAFLLPVIGGLLTGLCVKYLAPETAGTGIDLFLDTFHNKSGIVRRRTPFVKFLASTLTIASGGSAGKEGPMAVIGAGIGSLLGRLVKMGARARRTLLLAGAAGGLGAIFRAPLGGAITAVEVLYKEDFEADSLLPCIISSVTAYTIFSSFLGFNHNLQFHTTIFSSPIELLFYVILGLACSGFGYIFIWIFKNSRDKVFQRIPVKKVYLPAIGGALIGITALVFPHVIGEGMGVIQSVINGNYPEDWKYACLFFLALAFFKMITTSITIQSGGSGGALIPSMFIGAMIGGSFGTLCHHFFPAAVPSVIPYIVVGMAAFFASVTNASLGALVMVTELTGSYELLPPLMIVAVISLVVSRKFSLYRNQVPNKFASQAHLWDMNPVNLKHRKLSQVTSKYQTKGILQNDTPYNKIEEITVRTQETDFIVQNSSGELVGFFSLKDVVTKVDDLNSAKGVLIAEDLISRSVFYLTEEDSLYLAVKYLADTDFDKVPIVRKTDGKLILRGYLRHKDILRYYYKMGLSTSYMSKKDTLF